MSWKIVSKSHEIYKSGALPEHRDTQTVTADLQSISDRLLHFLHESEKEKDLSEDDKALRRLCKSSNDIAEELIKRLQSVTPRDEGRAWKSFRSALKSVWIKTELDETAAQLQVYRTQLNTRILVSIKQRVDRLDVATQNLAISLKQNRTLFSTDQEIQTEYLTRYIASQHEKTRAMLASLTMVNTPSSSTRTLLSKHEFDQPPEQDLRVTIFEAVSQRSLLMLRRILRLDPSTIFAYNTSGQTALHIAAQMGEAKIVSYLLRNGARVNPDDDYGQTPLHCGAQSGSEEVVYALLAKGAEMEAIDNEGQKPVDFANTSALVKWFLTYGVHHGSMNDQGLSAMHFFCRKGDYDAVKFLLDHGADLEEFRPQNKRTPLIEASRKGHVKIVKLLLSRGADVHKIDNRKATSLINAAWNGYTQIAEMLLDHGANIEAQNQHNFTALSECCSHGRVETGRMLLKRGAKTERFDEDGYAPIHYAAWKGHYHLVKAILDAGGNANLPHSKTAYTALAEASKHGHLNLVKLLIERGAALETVTGSDRKTALLRAAQSGSREVMVYLLDQGANISAADHKDKTALLLAVARNDTESVQLLLNRNANIEARDDEQFTALCRACQSTHFPIVKLLLQAGADVNVFNWNSWSPLHEASFRGDFAISEILLNNGADPNFGNKIGRTPLYEAIRSKHWDVVRLLLTTKTIDVNIQAKDGRTALGEASHHGVPEIVRMLLENGAQSNISDNLGYSPLHRAAQSGCAGVVNLLIDLGKADVNAANQDGWTPLAEASWFGWPEIVKSLLSKGAKKDMCTSTGDSPQILAGARKHQEILALLS